MQQGEPQPTLPALKRGQFRPILPNSEYVDSGPLRKAKKSTGSKPPHRTPAFQSRKESEDPFPMDTTYHQNDPEIAIQAGLKRHRPDYIPYPQPETMNTLRINGVNRDYFKTRLSRTDSYNHTAKRSSNGIEHSALKMLQEAYKDTAKKDVAKKDVAKKDPSPPHSPDLFDEPGPATAETQKGVINSDSEYVEMPLKGKEKASDGPAVLSEPSHGPEFVPFSKAGSPFAGAISQRKVTKKEKKRDQLKAATLQEFSKMSPASKLAVIKEVREKIKETMSSDQDLAFRSSMVKKMGRFMQLSEDSEKSCPNENNVPNQFKTVYKNLSPILLRPNVDSVTTDKPSETVLEPDESSPVCDPPKTFQFRSKADTKTSDKTTSTKTRLPPSSSHPPTPSSSAPPPTSKAVSKYPDKENTATQPRYKKSKYRFRAPFYYKFHKDVGPNSTYDPNMSTALEIGDNFLGAIVELTSSKKQPSDKEPRSFLLSSPPPVKPSEITPEKPASNLPIPGDQLLFPMDPCAAYR